MLLLPSTFSQVVLEQKEEGRYIQDLNPSWFLGAFNFMRDYLNKFLCAELL